MTPAAVQTSWLRVEGPRDRATCSWCARWVGQDLPQELAPDYQRHHEQAGGAEPCRCTLRPEVLAPDPEAPDCLWC